MVPTRMSIRVRVVEGDLFLGRGDGGHGVGIVAVRVGLAARRSGGTAWNAGFSRHSGPQGRGQFVATPGALARGPAISANEVRLAARLRRAVPAEAGVPSRTRREDGWS